jgi:hypothetical protein
MAQTRNPSSDFNHAIRDAKKQRSGVAGEVSDAAETSTAASQVTDATTKGARNTAGSFEKALRNTVENQPIRQKQSPLVLDGCGRMHRPL